MRLWLLSQMSATSSVVEPAGSEPIGLSAWPRYVTGLATLGTPAMPRPLGDLVVRSCAARQHRDSGASLGKTVQSDGRPNAHGLPARNAGKRCVWVLGACMRQAVVTAGQHRGGASKALRTLLLEWVDKRCGGAQQVVEAQITVSQRLRRPHQARIPRRLAVLGGDEDVGGLVQALSLQRPHDLPELQIDRPACVSVWQGDDRRLRASRSCCDGGGTRKLG